MPVDTYVNTGMTAGTEVSSGGEGRVLTFEESVLVHPYHADGFVDGKDPVRYDNIVGVALKGAAAATDSIAIDTEGIFWLNVLGSVSDDSDTGVAEALSPGTPIYIKKTPGTDVYILSGQSDAVSWQPFGYTLSTVASSLTVPTLVAVKVHWDPQEDGTIQKGLSSAMWTSAKAGHSFLSLRADASNASGDHRLIYSALTLSGAGGSGESIRGRTVVTAALGGAGSAHGMHGGIEFGTGGDVGGQAYGVRGTFMAPNRVSATGGTVAGGLSELFAGGDATDYTTYANHAIHHFANIGEATGRATAENVWSFSTLSATQNQAHNAWLASISRSLRVIVDGAVFYLPLSTAP